MIENSYLLNSSYLNYQSSKYSAALLDTGLKMPPYPDMRSSKI